MTSKKNNLPKKQEVAEVRYKGQDGWRAQISTSDLMEAQKNEPEKTITIVRFLGTQKVAAKELTITHIK